ncbi:[Acyl-carrier-protein] phosphodiesterase [Flavobacteriaceae bacterium UJ101]|nr:[Acyl-carrier-protein] phosphodiesterase [Flavobacteriaceae bacterium UJ101]
MNFLAHQYLSMDVPAIKAGNLLGEFVRGKKYGDYPEMIQKGILLHRKIDDFTDKHEVVLNLVREMNPVFHKYAPVISDVFFDYCLAKNWWKFSEVSLQDFCDQTYDDLESFSPQMPEKVQEMIISMREHNWLYHYQNLEGIQHSLKNLKRRTSFDNNIEDAVKYLYTNEEKIEKAFLKFFPDIQKECKTFLESD